VVAGAFLALAFLPLRRRVRFAAPSGRRRARRGRPTLAARQRAQQILEESARYNLGRRRTVNCPTVGLSFLHPRNQPRFTFHVDGREEKQGTTAWKVSFAERARPSLSRTTRGEDVPARGMLWIEAAGAALVASRLELR
jgi:hypothetical protein